MTWQELMRFVAMGEGTYLEFKRKVPRPERIAKELIAFANTKGGRLLLGVDDDGSVLGARDAEEEEFALCRAMQECVSPPVQFSVERVPITRRRDVLVVRVPESSEKPHFLNVRRLLPAVGEQRGSGHASREHEARKDHGTQHGHARVRDMAKAGESRIAYLRVRDESVEASREAVRLMVEERNAQPVTFEFGEKELMLMRYLDDYGRITVEQFARIADITRPVASKTLVLLTRANVLRLHTDPRGDYFTPVLHG